MTASQPLRIGLIGLDTSHVVAFAKVLNDPAHPEHIPGFRVTGGWPGGSADFELSRGRVENFTRQVRDESGVQILQTPEAVAEQSDLVCLTAVDGRVHRELFDRIAPYRKPTFIDKPFATSLVDARAIFDRARQAGVPVMSCSSLRYADHLVAALNSMRESDDKLLACDVFGAFSEEPTQPGWFWYGIHLVEIMQRAMGRGCREISAHREGEMELLTARYADGRTATIRGLRAGHRRYGATLHGEKTLHQLDLSAYRRSWYATMLDAIVSSLPAGRSDIEPRDTLEVIAIIEAANQSRESGKPVEVSQV